MILTLALAIGANAAVFSVLRAVVGRAAATGTRKSRRALHPIDRQRKFGFVAARRHRHPRAQPRLRRCRDAAAHARNDHRHGWPRALEGFMTSWPALSVLGVRPELGRFFTADDERAGSGEPIVVSDRMWRQILGADAGAIRTSGYARCAHLSGDRRGTTGFAVSAAATGIVCSRRITSHCCGRM